MYKRTVKRWWNVTWNKNEKGEYFVFDYKNISPKAKKKVFGDPGAGSVGKQNNVYPFNRMVVGQAFYIMLDENITRQSLEACKTYYYKTYNKSFRVIKHVKQNCYEIVRVN
jgi:hypothetical protein